MEECLCVKPCHKFHWTLLLVDQELVCKQNLHDLQRLAAPTAESPAAIKLVVGCVQQLRQAALLQEPPCAQDRCACTFCTGFQAFLKDPYATWSHGVATSKDAWHVVRWVLICVMVHVASCMPTLLIVVIL